MQSSPAPVEVFCAYAPADEPLFHAFEKHLSLLQRQAQISLWHVRQIVAGTDWKQAIDDHLDSATVILLLISPEFFASDYCYGIELQRAMERHEANEARVIPILLRPVDWHHMPFEHLVVLPTTAQPITTWRNRDTAFVDVVAGIRRAIEDLGQLAVSAPASLFPRAWNIPYPRNPFFTGRDALLTQLATELRAGQAMALPQAISGLGGVGKTQIAVEYAYRFRRNYRVVLWARAESQEALTSSFVSIAHLLNLPQKEEQDQSIIVEALITWLQRHAGWLLIFDNVDDLAIVRTFLPPVFDGHLLLTTRAQAMGRLAHKIEVDVLSPEVGALFLLRRAGILAAAASLEDAQITDREHALLITQELGGLPLALDQAGAYLEETGASLSDYEQVYQQHRAELLKQRRGLVADHPEPVATTWSLSFTQVEERNLAAADLLRLCAYLAPDAIPEEIITQGAAYLGPRLASVAADVFLLGQAMETLRAYSLLGRDPSTHTLSVHRLVQAVLHDAMDGADRQCWAERAIQAVQMALPAVEHENWSQWERVLAHVLACSEWIEQFGISFREATTLLQQTGWYLMERARYGEAEPLLKRAYRISEQEQGTEHLDTARDALTLAYLYNIRGKYEQAEPLYQRALVIYEQQLGPTHPQTATSLNNLALLYGDQGKYEQTEPLHQRALAICEQQLGPLHPHTASSLNNLAALYQSQGNYEQAEPLYQRALAIYEQQLGPLHPYTANSFNNLAHLYYVQDKYEQAEPLYQRALAIREQQVGPEHPDTAQSLNNLAVLYRSQGKYAEAELLYQRTLSICEQRLGPEHPHAANSLNNLAYLYQSQGKDEQAEPLYQRALVICEQQLGPTHPQTAASLNNLAYLYNAQGKDEQAEPLFQRALAIWEQQVGPPHPDMTNTLNNLAHLYYAQGKYEQAEPLLVRACSIWEQHLGAQHPDTANSLNNLALLYYTQGKHEQAEPLCQRVLSIREQHLGAQHPDTANSLNNLALLYYAQGKYEQAEPLLVRACSIWEQRLGSEHPHTLVVRRTYTALLHAMGRDEEAEAIETPQEGS